MSDKERVRTWLQDRGIVLKPGGSVSRATVEQCAWDLNMVQADVCRWIGELRSEVGAAERKAA